MNFLLHSVWDKRLTSQTDYFRLNLQTSVTFSAFVNKNLGSPNRWLWSLDVELIIKALVWGCECLGSGLDIPSDFSPLTKPPAVFCAEWNLRFRSEGFIWKCWSCVQTRGCHETMPFVWHTIAFQPQGSSLDLHRSCITFMSSDTDGNRVTNSSKKKKSLHTFCFLSSGLLNCWIGTLFHILLKWCQAFHTAAALIMSVFCRV